MGKVLQECVFPDKTFHLFHLRDVFSGLKFDTHTPGRIWAAGHRLDTSTASDERCLPGSTRPSRPSLAPHSGSDVCVHGILCKLHWSRKRRHPQTCRCCWEPPLRGAMALGDRQVAVGRVGVWSCWRGSRAGWGGIVCAETQTRFLLFIEHLPGPGPGPAACTCAVAASQPYEVSVSSPPHVGTEAEVDRGQ